MTVGDFEHKNAPRWEEFERMVESVEKGRPMEGADQLPKRFRELCADLSLAESRMYGAQLVDRLNGLVIRGYKLIYRGRSERREAVVTFLAETFPQTVRREWRLFWLCSAVFCVPFLAVMLSAHHEIAWVQAILGADGMASMDQMYGGQSQQVQYFRSEYGSNFMMFCFYIYNNVSIDFRIFAGGMAAGLGTLFYLLFNGIHIGASAGYVNYACDPESFWSFVSSHSSFELVGMILSGVAGMRIGSAIVRPGRLPRVRALVEASKRALPLMYGAALLTTLAAVIEGFWSAQPIAPWMKYAAGGAGWILLGLYFGFAGREGRDAS